MLRNFTGRWLIIGSIIVIMLVAAVTLHLRRSSAIERVPPRSGPIIEAIYGLGTVKVERDFELKTGVTVRVLESYAEEGQYVAKGTPLLRLDESGVFRAPISGVITSLPFHVDDTAFAQQPILKIEDLRDRYIEVSIEQRGALRIRKGQPAQLVFESLRNERFTGKVRSLYPRAGDFIARIDVEVLPEQVLPGMTADVAIEVARTEKALLIPVSAVSQGRVLRERDGHRVPVEVRLGAVDGSWAEVLDGEIRPDDFLVIRKQPEKR